MENNENLSTDQASFAGFGPNSHHPYELGSQDGYGGPTIFDVVRTLSGEESFVRRLIDPTRAKARFAEKIRRYDAAIQFAARGGAGLKVFEQAALDALTNQLRRETPVEAAEGRTMKEASCCNRGDFWIVGYRGEEQLLRDGKGLYHLAYLLRHPDREIAALDLIAHSGAYQSSALDLTATAPQTAGFTEAASALEAFGSAGEILDRKARTNYRRRLEQITDELVEAKRFGHVERALGLEAEQDWLRKELRRTSGLGGRPREAAKGAELARVNVTRAIRGAIERIADAAPALGLHLHLSVKTGGSCCYRTGFDGPVRWAL